MRMYLITLSIALLSGCASLAGSNITFEEGEQERCREVGCSVWTRAELEMLVRQALKTGYEAGYKAALGAL